MLEFRFQSSDLFFQSPVIDESEVEGIRCNPEVLRRGIKKMFLVKSFVSLFGSSVLFNR